MAKSQRKSTKLPSDTPKLGSLSFKDQVTVATKAALTGLNKGSKKNGVLVFH